MESRNVDSRQAAAKSSSPPSTPRRLLVIDDEPLLGQTLVIAFRGRYDVEVATTGGAALELLENGASFDFILCDMMLPDVSGRGIYERLAATRPELIDRLYWTTGGALTAATREFVDVHASRCLEKPFTIDEVDALVTNARASS
ncbi:MAG TPA: response regulator [Polyangiaceae bacterium]|jgi:CheY-like chemotaxis protein